LRSYGKSGVVEEIRAAGGEVYAVTSEPQRLASKAQKHWELPFESVGDPHHEISGACRDRGLLDLIVNPDVDLLIKTEGSTLSHPKGYYQPGVLAMDSNGRVLYRWRGIPTRKNIGGAVARPTPEHVFKNISGALAEPTTANERADAALDTDPELDQRGAPWLLFVSLLIANGWFLKAQTFGYAPGRASTEVRARNAAIRLLLFLVAWGAAFATLPTLLVGVALAAWGAWITPQVRMIHQQFQNVSVES